MRSPLTKPINSGFPNAEITVDFALAVGISCKSLAYKSLPRSKPRCNIEPHCNPAFLKNVYEVSLLMMTAPLLQRIRATSTSPGVNLGYRTLINRSKWEYSTLKAGFSSPCFQDSVANVAVGNPSSRSSLFEVNTMKPIGCRYPTERGVKEPG